MTYDDESDKSSERLPRERLLKALTGVYDLIAAVLPPAGRRLITRCARTNACRWCGSLLAVLTPLAVHRPPKAADLEAELAGRPDASLDFDGYEALARAVFRRVALDRGRRLLLGVASGVACIAVLKATLRRTPLVGPLFHSIVVPLLPCGAGPALGVAACAYWPEDNAPLSWKPAAPRRRSGGVAGGGGATPGARLPGSSSKPKRDKS